MVCYIVLQRKRLKLAVVVSGDHVPVHVLVSALAGNPVSTSTLMLTLAQRGVGGALEDVTRLGVHMEELDTYTDMCTTQEHATIEKILTVVCIIPKDTSCSYFVLATVCLLYTSDAADE